MFTKEKEHQLRKILFRMCRFQLYVEMSVVNYYF